MNTCQYIKRDGVVCGKGCRGDSGLCGHHRPKPAAKPFAPCESCGAQTRRIVDGSPLCMKKGCGWNEYRRSVRAAKKAAPAIAEAEAQAANMRAICERIRDEAEAAAAAEAEAAAVAEREALAVLAAIQERRRVATAKLAEVRTLPGGALAAAL